ncbi:MAG: ATP-binding cassette domain-containing protein [Hyphomicrobiales bacterium]|nr:ATP-binding cassette domain-containing protein [Hyphomicrobiales bacterium]MCP5373374.1 ATP-binding cassette domain-containing protein [Hyphomicrobiales bacterium]
MVGQGLEVWDIARAGVHGAGFAVPAGHCLVITGPSGSGKSVLLRAVADLDEHAGGARLDGVDRAALPATEWRRRVCYVPAEPGWWRPVVGDHFTDRDRAAGLLARLGLPAEALDWRVERLSTGERQRIALARAVAGKPAVLLLDEPTSGLDRDATGRVEDLLRELMGGGLALVLVTHDLNLADRLGGTRMAMDHGRLTEAA